MKPVTKIISILLVGVMLLSLVACVDNGDDPAKTDPSTATTVGGDATDGNLDENGYIKDSLDPDLDFGGEEFNILAWEHSLPEFDVEEQTGDPVENSVFVRNANTEERLGVSLNFHIIKGNSGAFRDFCMEVENSVSAGSADAYDAIGCYLRSAGVMTNKHLLVDLNEIDHIDFTKPWWSDSLLELNTIHDRLYFISGDIASTLIYQMMFMIYNNDLGLNSGLTNPQNIAIEGNWTLDLLFTMAKDIYSDTDNDATKSEGDTYGLFSYSHPNLDIFYMGSDLHYMIPDNDGNLKISSDLMSDKSLDILDRLIALYDGNDGWFSKSISSGTVFAEGNSLFYNITGQILAQDLRETDMDYSILPAPKYNESQRNYRTAVAFTHTMYCIPTNAPDTNMSGAVLECMASEAYRKVTPTLFETCFKYQYTNNPNDVILFEEIRNNVVFDICRPFFDSVGGDSDSPVRVWRNQIIYGENLLASSKAMLEKSWKKYLETLSKELSK